MPSPRINVECPNCGEFLGQLIPQRKNAVVKKPRPKPKAWKCKVCKCEFLFTHSRKATVTKVGETIINPDRILPGARMVRKLNAA